MNWNKRILIEAFFKAGMNESNIVQKLERDRRTLLEVDRGLVEHRDSDLMTCSGYSADRVRDVPIFRSLVTTVLISLFMRRPLRKRDVAARIKSCNSSCCEKTRKNGAFIPSQIEAVSGFCLSIGFWYFGPGNIPSLTVS